MNSWIEIGHPSQGGHRYFLHSEKCKIAIADNSGLTPEKTDDGILWVLSEEEIWVQKTLFRSEGTLEVILPVYWIKEKREVHVRTCTKDLIWLVSEEHISEKNIFFDQHLWTSPLCQKALRLEETLRKGKINAHF